MLACLPHLPDPCPLSLEPASHVQARQRPDLMHGQQVAAPASRAASAGPGSLQRRLLNARLRLSGGQGILLQTVGPISLPLLHVGGCTAASIADAGAQMLPSLSAPLGMLLRGHLCQAASVTQGCLPHGHGAESTHML